MQSVRNHHYSQGAHCVSSHHVFIIHTFFKSMTNVCRTVCRVLNCACKCSCCKVIICRTFSFSEKKRKTCFGVPHKFGMQEKQSKTKQKTVPCFQSIVCQFVSVNTGTSNGGPASSCTHYYIRFKVFNSRQAIQLCILNATNHSCMKSSKSMLLKVHVYNAFVIGVPICIRMHCSTCDYLVLNPQPLYSHHSDTMQIHTSMCMHDDLQYLAIYVNTSRRLYWRQIL